MNDAKKLVRITEQRTGPNSLDIIRSLAECVRLESMCPDN
jgi:hypothetical protein